MAGPNDVAPPELLPLASFRLTFGIGAFEELVLGLDGYSLGRIGTVGQSLGMYDGSLL
jgi:hypothetical protein